MTRVMSMSPLICPRENPWSMGMITAFLVFLSMIRSILMSFPIIPDHSLSFKP